jgi:hypothetical protein
MKGLQVGHHASKFEQGEGRAAMARRNGIGWVVRKWLYSEFSLLHVSIPRFVIFTIARHKRYDNEFYANQMQLTYKFKHIKDSLYYLVWCRSNARALC